MKEKGLKRIQIDDFPAIKKHLDTFLPELEKRTDKGDTPYNLRNCAYMDDFFSEKITWGNLNLEASYCIAEAGMFINAPCPMIVPANKYLLAVLNSKLADYYIRGLGVTRNGGYFEYKPMFVEKLPVPILPAENQYIFENIVDQIMMLKSTDMLCMDFINLINEKVYEIYGLEQLEIQFIDNQ